MTSKFKVYKLSVTDIFNFRTLSFYACGLYIVNNNDSCPNVFVQSRLLIGLKKLSPWKRQMFLFLTYHIDPNCFKIKENQRFYYRDIKVQLIDVYQCMAI